MNTYMCFYEYIEHNLLNIYQSTKLYQVSCSEE